ncbi:MAG: AbrB/MazE/SpoVT family DNA-binding domain-containing protein [Ruminococcus sp.]|jgi:antitoxin component of MazEF toxin-antitoxin module|nr:AbrB/MazE/SpoVT family DNA-binding domain-containing protein [Ruminococcus sp.]
MERTINLGYWGKSIGLRLPKNVTEALGLDSNSSVSYVLTDNKELIIKPVYEHKTIKERFKNYTGSYHGEELDWGEDVGEEIIK